MTDFLIKHNEDYTEVFDPLEDDEPIHVFDDLGNPTVEDILKALGFDVAVE